MRPTLAGYAFSLFYEDGTRPLSPYIILDGKHHYPCDLSSASTSQSMQPSPQCRAPEIFVPFPRQTRNTIVVLCDGIGAASAVEVLLEEEFYSLQADIGLDAGAVVPGCSTDVPIRCCVLSCLIKFGEVQWSP
jgi:hypothetical protein